MLLELGKSSQRQQVGSLPRVSQYGHHAQVGRGLTALVQDCTCPHIDDKQYGVGLPRGPLLESSTPRRGSHSPQALRPSSFESPLVECDPAICLSSPSHPLIPASQWEFPEFHH